ncbi:importin-9-like [Limulus polyphemus]|uniref:Importin-9-like n=1 Tax=Limulus polyphemus TaxID=6850 RepID=A0ABM1S544_LIMPO|nr:importin-9-like [Limulus polyphemus]
MAASVSDTVNKTLKEALFETLSGILSPAHDVRVSAEEQLKVLEVTDEFGLHLAELTIEPNGQLAIRQLASVLLKQYVEAHWSSQSEKFRPPETTEEVKAAIRQILPHGLREPISKVRSSVAYAISAVAHWDWPEAWPQLFDLLMEALTSGDSNAVHGAMRVLTEFSREVTDNQMLQVAPVILPEMYKIFREDEKYAIRTRGRAVEIFATCAQMIAIMAEYNKGVAKSLLYPVLPQFTEALVQALQVTDGMTSDSGLKKEVLNALTVLVKHTPKQMSSWLPHILTPVWNCLTESASIYIKTVVNDTEEGNNPVDSDGKARKGLFSSWLWLEFDSGSSRWKSGALSTSVVLNLFESMELFWHEIYVMEFFTAFITKNITAILYHTTILTIGEVLGFENLVFSIFEFVSGLVEAPRFRGMVKKGLADLMYYILLYMQITEEQVCFFPFLFFFSLEFQSLCQEFESESAVGLCNAVTKHLQEAEVSKNSGNPYWWKLHESCMVALGSVKDLILEQIQNNQLQFNLVEFLQSVVLVDLSSSVSPFLVGRCLWTASRYPIAMSPDLTQRFLQVTVSGLQASQPSSVRVSAVRAVWGFCDHLKTSNQTSVIGPYLAPIMEGLLSLATQFSSEVLTLAMEAIQIVLSIDKDFTATVEGKVSPLAIAVFLKHSSDPVLVSLSQEIFKELCTIPSCQGNVLQRLLPTIVSILNAPTDKITMGLQAVSLDVLQTVVRSSSKPLLEALITQAFPAAVRCILNTDDNTTVQNGGECLRAYVSVALEQITAWHDEVGHNGLYYTLQVAQHLLDPKTPESSAAFVGRLVSSLIAKAGTSLAERTELLLRAVLSKMQQTETLSVIQSLIMVFAHLIHHQMDAVLEFLCGVPGPTGKSALEFVLTEWCSRQHLFFGAYESKVSTLALCKLLEHGVENNDQRLVAISVKGDQIFNSISEIRTRSKSSQSKILYAYFGIYNNSLLDIMDFDDDFEDIEADQENASSALSNVLSQFAPASDYAGYDIEDEDEEDPDALADPLYHINLQEYLTQFLKLLAQQPYYSTFSQHHTPQEKQVLQIAGISI